MEFGRNQAGTGVSRAVRAGFSPLQVGVVSDREVWYTLNSEYCAKVFT